MNISKSNIKIDLSKSFGSYLYDIETGEKFLDLMSMYSSLPLGYNHPVFDSKEYEKKIIQHSKVKICNCEYSTEEKDLFEKEFLSLVGLEKYDFVHFCSTGSIAIELSIKAAIDISGKPNGKVVYFSKSFHGILGYSNFITDRVGATKKRLDNFINHKDWFLVDKISDLNTILKKHHEEISCVIVEPIKCTQGDLYYSNEELKKIFSLSKKFNVLTISDEIQTGFFSTGKPWFTDNLADIIVFGKKSQVSGFLTNNQLGKKLEPIRYCVTWDGDLLDMIRCRYIMKTILSDNLDEKIQRLGFYFLEELKKIKGIKNVRGVGFILAFDFETEKERDSFYKNCLKNNLLVNLTGSNSIRLRPNLNFQKEDIDETIRRIKMSV